MGAGFGDSRGWGGDMRRELIPFLFPDVTGVFTARSVISCDAEFECTLFSRLW